MHHKQLPLFIGMSQNARCAETLKRRRENEKERRQQRCTLDQVHLDEMRKRLESVQDGKPKHSLIAKQLIDTFHLTCSVDWLRQVVRTKWQEWTGM